jgi:hypothetical protein
MNELINALNVIFDFIKKFFNVSIIQIVLECDLNLVHL